MGWTTLQLLQPSQAGTWAELGKNADIQVMKIIGKVGAITMTPGRYGVLTKGKLDL